MFIETIALIVIGGYLYARGYRVKKTALPMIGN
jgi:hypothetical protein